MPPEVAALLAVPERFDDPVILAVFDDPPVETAAEGAFDEVPAAIGLAEAKAVSNDPGFSLLICSYEVYEFLL